MLRTQVHSFTIIMVGCLTAGVARAGEAPLPWEAPVKKTPAPAAKPAPAAPVGKPAPAVSAARPAPVVPAAPVAKPAPAEKYVLAKPTPAAPEKPAPGTKSAPPDKAASPLDKAAGKLAPPAAPAPAKPAKPKVVPAPAPKAPVAAPTTHAEAPSDFEQRWSELQGALYRAGVLEPPHADDTRKQAIEAELAKLEAQQKSLDAAVQGGLDPQAIKSTVANIQKRTEELEQELQGLHAADTVVPAGPKAPLVERLDALEASLKRLDARVASSASPMPRAASPAAPVASAPSGEKEQTGAGSAITAGYDDGFVLRSADGKFKLQPTGYLQVRFSHEWLEKAPDRTAFSLPRARAGMKGNLFTKDFKYNFLVDFGKGRYELSYYYLDYTVIDGYLAVRAGVQKRPFSRAFLTGSEKLEFASTAATGKAFGDAHDLGVELHNGTPTFEYAAGIFNGNGSKGTFSGDVKTDPAKGTGKVTGGDFNNVPDRFHPALVLRMAYNHGDIQGYSDADLEGGAPRFTVGVAGMSDLDYDNDDASYLRGTADAVVKAYGFSAQAGGYVSSRQVGKAFDERAYEASGLLAESGFVFAKQFQPVVRYAWLTPAKPAYDTHELAAGFNLYFHKHALKSQNEFDVRLSHVKDDPRKDFAVMTQAQFIF